MPQPLVDIAFQNSSKLAKMQRVDVYFGTKDRFSPKKHSLIEKVSNEIKKHMIGIISWFNLNTNN